MFNISVTNRTWGSWCYFKVGVCVSFDHQNHFIQRYECKQILKVDDGNVGITSAYSIAMNLTHIIYFLGKTWLKWDIGILLGLWCHIKIHIWQERYNRGTTLGAHAALRKLMLFLKEYEDQSKLCVDMNGTPVLGLFSKFLL